MKADVDLYPGDRVHYLAEVAAYGTVLSHVHDARVSVKLDDGRAVRLLTAELSRLDRRPRP